MDSLPEVEMPSDPPLPADRQTIPAGGVSPADALPPIRPLADDPGSPSVGAPSPLLTFATSLAQIYQEPREKWCGHELSTEIEVARGTCIGCFVRDGMEAGR